MLRVSAANLVVVDRLLMSPAFRQHMTAMLLTLNHRALLPSFSAAAGNQEMHAWRWVQDTPIVEQYFGGDDAARAAYADAVPKIRQKGSRVFTLVACLGRELKLYAACCTIKARYQMTDAVAVELPLKMKM